MQGDDHHHHSVVVVDDDDGIDIDGRQQQANAARQVLQENLQTLGWSPIRCHKVGYTVPSHAAIQGLFSSRNNNNNNNRMEDHAAHHHHHLMTYRSQEESADWRCFW
jgi:hypothetical protein